MTWPQTSGDFRLGDFKVQSGEVPHPNPSPPQVGLAHLRITMRNPAFREERAKTRHCDERSDEAIADRIGDRS